MAAGEWVVAGGGWGALRATGQLGPFALLCLGIWLHAGDLLVTATLMPAAVAQIGGTSLINWTVALYQLGSIVTGATTGALVRRAGLRRVFVAGALTYAAGCALAALAPDMAVLLAGRLLQGIGGGAMLALSYVAVQLLFPEPLWTRVYGASSAIWAAAALCGPLIGGLFAEAGIWRGAFWFFGAQALLLAVAAGRWLRPAGRDATATPGVSWLPLLLLSAAVLAVSEAGAIERPGWSVALGLSGLALLVSAALADGRAKSPVFPRQILALATPLGRGLLMVLLLSAGTTAFWSYGPLVLQLGFGVDPLWPGLIMAAESLSWALCSMLVATVPPARQPGWIIAGVALAAAGSAGLALAMPLGALVAVALCLAAQGAGFGLSWPFVLRRMIVLAPTTDRVVAGTATPTVQRIGYAVGAAATGITANAVGLGDGATPDIARAAGFSVFAAFVPLLLGALVAAIAFARRGTIAS